MIRKVHLLGNLGEKFGPVWNVHCTTVSECLRLIECQADGFKKYLVDIANQGTNFAVRTGEELIGTGEELYMNVNAEDVYITEVPAGAGGWGKIIVGALIIVAAIAIVFATGGTALSAAAAAGQMVGTGFAATMSAGWAALGNMALAQIAVMTLASIGLNLVMAGVNELMMPKPDKGKSAGAFFSGPVNTIKQGQPVPLLYGELIVGGAPISVSFTKSKITSTGYVYNSVVSVPDQTQLYSGGSPEMPVTPGSPSGNTDSSQFIDIDKYLRQAGQLSLNGSVVAGPLI